MKYDKKGFTLVELIVVIAIMAVLAGVVSGATVGILNKKTDEVNYIYNGKQIIENFIKIGKDKQDLIKELFKKISKLVESANADLANGKEPRYAKFYELKDRIDRLKANLDSDKSFNDVYMSAAYNFCLHQELDFATLMVRPEKSKSDRDKKIFEYVKQHGYYFFSLAGLIENTIDTLQTALDGWE